jgi:hypothetical protein
VGVLPPSIYIFPIFASKINEEGEGLRNFFSFLYLVQSDGEKRKNGLLFTTPAGAIPAMEGLVECIETASTSQPLAIKFALCIMTSFDDFETPGGGGGEEEEGGGG